MMLRPAMAIASITTITMKMPMSITTTIMMTTTAVTTIICQ